MTNHDIERSEDDWDEPKKRAEKLNLSHLTPEEIARAALQTPPPPERQVDKEIARRKRSRGAAKDNG